MIVRSIFSILLFVAVVVFPWWAALAIAFVGLIYFNRYVEACVAGVLLDILHASLGFGWWYTVATCAGLFVAGMVRARIR